MDDACDIAQEALPRLLPGTVVDHFKVLRLLGRGGMSEVHLARDIRLGRKVAIKLILGDKAASPKLKRLLRAEAQATASFSHPNIVTIYHVGDHEGSPYLALEYLEGETLAARTRRERLGAMEIVRIALGIAQALREAHHRGIFHRDLKPENVVITSSGLTKVLDFGIAGSVHDAATPEVGQAEEVAERMDRNVTERTLVVVSREDTAMEIRGTPLFMAPEQWRRQESTGAMDVWALGMILYHATTGRRPYPVTSLQELVAAVTGPEPVPLEAVEESAPLLRGLIGRCLEKDPNHRPTAEEAVAELDRLLEGRRGSLPSDTCPFRGLLPFAEEHAALFFGRGPEVTAFVERLRQQPVLAVVGPSGAGKSSFIQAGVIPRLREQGIWIVLALRPGTAPFDHLASTLLAAESTPAGISATGPTAAMDTVPEQPRETALGQELYDNPGLLGLRLQRLAERATSRVLLFIDQLEELYSLIDDEEVRRRYMQAVCLAADDAEESVRVVFTLRDDSMGRIAEGPETREALSQVTVLRSPGRDALHEILVRPLEAVSYRYDDPDLVEEMLAEVRGEPACLPLLQFATRMLWERRDTRERLLLRAVYETMGGVGGALAEQADAVIAGISPGQEVVARQILLRLVTPEQTRRVRTYGDLLDGLGPEAEEVLQRLIEGRLVTVMRGQGVELAQAEVELVHESLIRAWGRLARWINESHEELAFLAELRQAAELWARRGEREDEVWQAAALHEAERWLARTSAAVPEVVHRFHQAGLDRERRRRRARRARRVGLTATLAVATVVSLVVAWAYSEKENQAEQARVRAVLRRAEAQREGARAALGRGALIEASAMVRATLEAKDSPHTRALWRQIRQHPLAWQRTLGAYVYAVAFSPDGRQLAAACQDRSIYLFDTRTQQVRFLRGHTDQILGMERSPVGDRLASGTWSGEVRLWHLASGKHSILPGHNREVWSLRFAPDGKLLATASMDGTVRLWEVATARQLRLLRGESGFMSVAISPDGKLLAAGEVRGAIRVWDLRTGAEHAVLRGHVDSASGLDFSPDGRSLASAGYDHSVRLWDLQDQAKSRVLTRIGTGMLRLRFSPDGSWLAAGGGDGTIHLWRAERGWRHSMLRGHSGAAYGIGFSPNSRLLASGSTDKTIRVWRLAGEARATDTPRSHRALIYGVDFSPDGKLLASGGRDRTILLWDVASGRAARALTASSMVFGVGFSPDGKLLATALSEGIVQLWSTETWATTATLPSHERELTAVSFSPDGKTLAAGCRDQWVRLWNLEDTRLRWKGTHHGAIFGVDFSPDGKTLASASFDGTIGLWETASGKERGMLRGHKAGVFGVAITGNDQLVSGSADGTVRLWEAGGRTSRVLRQIPARIYNIGLSPDGAWIGAPTSDHTARLWSLAGEKEIALRGHRGEVNFLTFSPDGRLVATSSDDETVRVWDARTGRPHWRAAVLLTAPPLLLTHRGWHDLERGVPAPVPRGTWARAIEERGRQAAMEGDTLCIHTEGQQIEVWDRSADRLLSTRGAPGMQEVIALPEGCLILSRGDGLAGPALLVPRSGDPRQLSAEATAVAWDHGTILVATPRQVLVFGPEGRRALPGRAGVRALVPVGKWLALGNQDGNIELVAGPSAAGRAAPRVYFDGVPSSPVVRLLAGPEGTLLAGFANGTLGLWSVTDGSALETHRLHGPIRYMVRRGAKLHVATELGDHTTIGLQDYLQSYCALLRQVWQTVPVVWEGGQTRLRAPPVGHPCAR